jgi:hypothetical protein
MIALWCWLKVKKFITSDLTLGKKRKKGGNGLLASSSIAHSRDNALLEKIGV